MVAHGLQFRCATLQPVNLGVMSGTNRDEERYGSYGTCGFSANNIRFDVSVFRRYTGYGVAGIELV